MPYEFYSHQVNEHNVESFNCEKCDFKTAVAWQMAEHQSTHMAKAYQVTVNHLNYFLFFVI